MAEGPRLAIVGSRKLEGYVGLREEVQLIIGAYQPRLIVTGFDPKTGLPLGVDKMAYTVATEWGLQVKTYPPQPTGPGRILFVIAARKRNSLIAENCDALVAIMVPGGSNGTKDTIAKARKAGKQVQVLILGEDGSGTLFSGHDV